MRSPLHVLGLVVLAAAPALATPSSLVQIPTTDVIAKDHGFSNVAATAYAGASLALGSIEQDNQIGIGHNIEVGCDYPMDAVGRSFVNAKWAVKHDGATRLAVGIGGVHPAHLAGNFVYLAASHTHDKWRLDLATTGTAAGWHGLAGFEYAENSRLTLFTDWCSGRVGATTLGFIWTLGDVGHPWGLTVAGVANNEGSGKGVYVNFGRSYSF